MEKKLRYAVYKDLKERGLVIKVEEQGLRLYDRQTSPRGPASAIILIKRFEDIIDFSYEKTIDYSSNVNDTIPVFNAKWSKKVSEEFIENQELKIRKWINFKLSNDSFILTREIEL